MPLRSLRISLLLHILCHFQRIAQEKLSTHRALAVVLHEHIQRFIMICDMKSVIRDIVLAFQCRNKSISPSAIGFLIINSSLLILLFIEAELKAKSIIKIHKTASFFIV